jgi:hypothetical protein
MKEYADEKKCDREHDGWDAERMADAVYGMLMAGSVLGYPLLVGAVAQHAEDDTSAGYLFARSGVARYGIRHIFSRAISLSKGAGAGDPSLRLKGGSAQDDASTRNQTTPPLRGLWVEASAARVLAS